jgi:hypothetical protein
VGVLAGTEVLPKGQGTSRTLYLPARSRFGEGRAAPLSYRYFVSKHFTKVTLGEIEGSPKNIEKNRIIKFWKHTHLPILCNDNDKV